MKNLIQFKLFHKMVQLGKYNIIAGNIITVGLVDSRMDFEADTPHTYVTSLFISNPDIVQIQRWYNFVFIDFIEFENELELYWLRLVVRKVKWRKLECIITVGLVDSRMDFEADTVRFGQSLKSPSRLWDFLRARKY
jgi:hypothetical protein